MFGFLFRLLSFVGNIPSILFLCLYIVLVFSFAKIYYDMPPRSFYHSTSKFEYQNLDKDADKILKKIKTEITKTFKSYYKTGTKVFDGWLIDVDKIKVSSLNVIDFPKEITFNINLITTYETNGKKHIYSQLSSVIKLPIKLRMVMEATLYSSIQIKESVSPEIVGIPKTPKFKVIFPKVFPFSSEKDPPELTIFPIPLKLYNDIIRFGQGYRGFPSMVSGHFSRMLYFSAGIATSNTFGDIVPLTQRARNAVTIEAILIIVIIGLFLNSLANDFVKIVLKKTNPNKIFPQTPKNRATEFRVVRVRKRNVRYRKIWRISKKENY